MIDHHTYQDLSRKHRVLVTQQCNHLSLDDWIEIEKLRRNKLSVCEIAPSTAAITPQYRAGRAHRKAQLRTERSRQPTSLTTVAAITHLVSKLRDGWALEMISGRARLDFPDT